MLEQKEIIKLILGLKVKYLRTKAGFSYQELSSKSGIGVSYLNEIEKAKKYPKPEKLIALAQALGVSYEDLISFKGDKRLQPAIDLLNSEFIRIFPFDRFGIDPGFIFDLFTKTPDRVAAFFSSLVTVVRKYQMSEEDFNHAALRSFQDLHNNYFQDLEDKAKSFLSTYQIGLNNDSQLSKILINEYGISINDQKIATQTSLKELRSYFNPQTKELHIQPFLTKNQKRFIFAREIAYQYLGIKERNLESRVIHTSQFEKLLNDFYASYFASAILLPKEEITKDLMAFFKMRNWNEQTLIGFTNKYGVSGETLFQRMTNILPHTFGLNDLFFLRLKNSEDLKTFTINKELHLSQLHEPYENKKDEKYCRRWISIQILKNLRTTKTKEEESIADAQISQYYNTKNAYLCLSMARKNRINPKLSSSVTIGFLINDDSRRLISFLDDPQLKTRIVKTTCERCAVPHCSERITPPIEIEKEEELSRKMLALNEL